MIMEEQPADEADPSPTTADWARPGAAEWCQQQAAGDSTAGAGTTALRRRIAEVDQSGPTVRAVIEVNPDAEEEAAARDADRLSGRVRGPLHGVPVLVKDNIDTADAMLTTAGSLALVDTRPTSDAPLVRRLRAAGAVVLAKANLSEWANYRSPMSTSGWSARGGLTRNPHDLSRSAGGSSSGSAAGVAAGLAPLAVGTETNGSIICPAALCGVVGLKPTVGLIPRTGIVPVALSQDSAGPIARSAVDCALLLGVLAGTDPADPATLVPERVAHRDYTAFCADDGLRGMRIGVVRAGMWGYHPRLDDLVEQAIAAMSRAGAVVVDPADIPSIDQISDADDLTLLDHEFPVHLGRYLATRPTGSPRSLEEVVAFNRAHADVELAVFGQETFERALSTRGLAAPQYLAARDRCRLLSRAEGIDAAVSRHRLAALVMPAYPPAWTIDLVNGDHVLGSCTTPFAMAGYPLITVPCGAVEGLPVGVAFGGPAWSEPILLRLAHAYECLRGPSAAPTYRNPQPQARSRSASVGSPPDG